MAAGIGPGDEVIVPSFTFFATASAVRRLGASIVFADIDPQTFNLDPARLEEAITPLTKAVIPVHLFGQCAAMDRICDSARRHGLLVIEDAAQAIGARDADGRAAGSLGTVGCFSFYPSNNLGAAGDGGLVTTSDPDLAHTMAIMRNHGMEPAYHHELLGGNFRLDGIQAAVLSVKLPHLDRWSEGRRANARDYRRLFAELDLEGRVGLPAERPGVVHIYNQFVVRIGDGRRDALMEHMRAHDVGCVIYYPSGCHTQPALRSHGYREGDFPETERAARETVALPIYSELTDEHKRTVVDVIGEFFGA
jgi:dTDP-4-amino-4,6-dideoxygalactose transaminase